MTRARLLALMVLTLGACRAPAVPEPVSTGIPLASPASLGFDSTLLDSVTWFLRTQVDSAFPGATVAIGSPVSVAASSGCDRCDGPRARSSGPSPTSAPAST